MFLKKRIALITTWFPPESGVATNRMEAFATFLSKDFEVEVFTLGLAPKSSKWNEILVHTHTSSKVVELLKSNTKDSKLTHNLKTALRILSLKIIKNPLRSWQVKTIKTLIARHELSKFSCVISSYSPVEAHLVCLDFLQLFPAVPWVADMRDEMSLNPNTNLRDFVKLQHVENRVNEFATAVTSVSLPILKDFERIMPNVKYFEEIRNGFNHDLKPESDLKRKSDVFQLGYFGSFYGKIKPNILFQALEDIISEHKKFQFQLNLTGVHNNFLIPSSLTNFITIAPKITYLEAIKSMMKMDANIMLHPTDNRKGVYSGKLFDYISARKAILAFVDDTDVAADLIRSFDCGYVAKFEDVESCKSIILQAHKDWLNGSNKMASQCQIASLKREIQVKKLKELIEKVIEN